jgi:hypothetical protein
LPTGSNFIGSPLNGVILQILTLSDIHHFWTLIISFMYKYITIYGHEHGDDNLWRILLYAEKTITINDQFYTIFRIGSFIKILLKMECNMIQIIEIMVTLIRIVILVLGRTAHTSNL